MTVGHPVKYPSFTNYPNIRCTKPFQFPPLATGPACAEFTLSSQDAVSEVLEAVVELRGEGVDGLLHHGVHVAVLRERETFQAKIPGSRPHNPGKRSQIPRNNAQC